MAIDFETMSEAEQLEIREQILEFNKNADTLPYRQVMRRLLRAFGKQQVNLAQIAVRDRDEILANVEDDDDAIDYISSIMDEAVDDLYEQFFGGRPAEGLTEEEMIDVLYPYVFGLNMFIYMSARDNQLSQEGGNELSDATMSGFIAQAEVNFNPLLAKFRDADDSDDEQPNTPVDRSKFH